MDGYSGDIQRVQDWWYSYGCTLAHNAIPELANDKRWKEGVDRSVLLYVDDRNEVPSEMLSSFLDGIKRVSSLYGFQRVTVEPHRRCSYMLKVGDLDPSKANLTL